jgi:hypothetical protein
MKGRVNARNPKDLNPCEQDQPGYSSGDPWVGPQDKGGKDEESDAPWNTRLSTGQKKGGSHDQQPRQKTHDGGVWRLRASPAVVHRTVLRSG